MHKNSEVADRLHLNVTPRLAWSLAQISQATGLSVNFLRYEVRRGNLPARKFGRRVLVADDGLKEYLRQGSKGASEGSGNTDDLDSYV